MCVYIYIYTYIYLYNIYIYIYIYIYVTGVCEKNTPPEKTTGGKTGSQSTESRGQRAVSAAGLQGQGPNK